MSWRTVIVSIRCKLDLKMGYVVIRSDEIKKIHLDEISMLIIENTAVSITGCLLSELANRKIKVVFCDEKRNPSSELISLYGSHDCSAKIKKQIMWTADTKAAVWTEIVSEKIRNQAALLESCGKFKEAEMLKRYLDELEFNDSSNREGHAAKVYFNALFGMDFTRSAENVTNAALNYGYSIILSAINREVVANGYITQLGLFHDNMFNPFNLSSDLIEPFRVLVDCRVHQAQFTEFTSKQKYEMVNLLNETVTVDAQRQYFTNALKIYCKSVFAALNENDMSLIRFCRYEL